MNKNEYSPIQLDVLKELANVGGGNAATSISQLVNKFINMTVPTIDILNYTEVFRNIMPEDEMVVAVSLRMIGAGNGNFLFVCTSENAERLVEMMLPQGMELNEEIEYSALSELVNIVVTSYLNAISKMLDINLVSSVPALAVDMFGAILSSAYMESEQFDENVMIIKNEFLYEGEKVDSALYFIPRPGVLSNLFKLIGV
ncbi:chemotaxis protein CheC [Alkalibacter mobilis]|uniref:chemotaxis protein CheC n=1 Tax=Alkalibacter mobilis TaxID=2787712 RepID=UPI001A9A8CAF|nr:chemotaxis protein CheC [Alkalibacter mobilis]